MRVLIVICLCATALAIPQGYNYQHQQNSIQIGLPQITGSSHSHTSSSHSSASHGSSHEGHSFLQEAIQNTKLMQSLLGGTSGSQNNFHQQHSSQSQLAPQTHQQQQQFQFQPQSQSYQPPPLPNFAAPHQHHQQQQYQQSYHRQQHTPVVTKDIYVHVAPEEQEERYAPAPLAPAPPPRKHYRIVFIKAPTHSASSSALQIKQAPIEEKTIIYVLTKKPDPVDIEAALHNVAPQQPSKPEVYFIKYKTQEEAQHAQRTIQAQYDQLGGTTQVSDEGVAPITSVIGSLDQQSTGHGHSGGGASQGAGSAVSSSGHGLGSGSGSVGGSSSSKYLPPLIRI